MQTTNAPVRTKPWTFGSISTAAIGDLEREYLLRVLDKGRVFRYIDEGAQDSEALRLESLYRERLGVEYCLGVNAGTSALIAALIGAGIGPGDEVIIPAYTYVATASAVVICRAVPVVVDVDDTLTMDPAAFERAITPHTKAVIPVHMRGIPCQMEEIMAIAREHELIVIEDNAQSNGGSYRGTPLGAIGDVGCFSLQQHKLVTAGEGGLIATNNADIYARAQVYHDSAFVYWELNKDRAYDFFPGENYRLSEINAAIALAQSERLDSLVDRLRTVKRTIIDGINDLETVEVQRIPDPEGDAGWSLVFYLPSAEEAQAFAERVRAEGIPCGTTHSFQKNGFPDRHIYTSWSFLFEKRGVSEKDNPWTNEHYQGSVEYSPDMCAQTLDLLGRAVSIFLHQDMTEEDCDDVVQAIRKVALSS